jgi:hypothetical protein
VVVVGRVEITVATSACMPPSLLIDLRVKLAPSDRTAAMRTACDQCPSEGA